MAVRATFREGSQVFLELAGRQGSKFYLIPTEVHDVTAACVDFEKQNDNDFQFYVSRESLSGDYDIYLNIDDLRYDTKCSVKL